MAHFIAIALQVLMYWNKEDTEEMLEELEEVLIVSDFGPNTSLGLTETLRGRIEAGELKAGANLKVSRGASARLARDPPG